MNINNNESNANIEKKDSAKSGKVFSKRPDVMTNDGIQKLHKELNVLNIIDRNVVCGLIVDTIKLEYNDITNAGEQGRLFCELKKRLDGNFIKICEKYTNFSMDWVEQRMNLYIRFVQPQHEILKKNLPLSVLLYLSRRSITENMITRVMEQISQGKLNPKFEEVKGFLLNQPYDKDHKTITVWTAIKKMDIIPHLIRDHEASMTQALTEEIYRKVKAINEALEQLRAPGVLSDDTTIKSSTFVDTDSSGTIIKGDKLKGTFSAPIYAVSEQTFDGVDTLDQIAN